MNKFDLIRKKYGVPAKMRARVYVDGELAEIVGAAGQQLEVKVVATGERKRVHPLYGIEYDATPKPMSLTESLKRIGGSINVKPIFIKHA